MFGPFKKTSSIECLQKIMREEKQNKTNAERPNKLSIRSKVMFKSLENNQDIFQGFKHQIKGDV